MYADVDTGVTRLVVLGAAGDLATRFLLPALAHLIDVDPAAARLSITALDRSALGDDDYRALVRQRLDRWAGHLPEAARRHVLDALTYHRVDIDHARSLASYLGAEPALLYFALPPTAYARAVDALTADPLVRGSRIVLEKPFGTDGASARALRAALDASFGEQHVYCADHFLYHQATQDLLALRLHDGLLASGWSHERIERVDVVWEESAPVGERAGYYDHTGALRDMVQSHLLQLLAAVAMEPPVDAGPEALRAARAAVLARVRPPEPGDAARCTVRGRYTAGADAAGPLRAYVDEPGVDPVRQTETYAGVRLTVDHERWRGVPFDLRTGKALGAARKHVEVHFRPAPGRAGAPGTSLRCELQPDRLVLRTLASGRGGLPSVEPVELVATREPQPLPASARLLGDVLREHPAMTVRADEVQECWRIADAIRDAWVSTRQPLVGYPAGSTGPRW